MEENTTITFDELCKVRRAEMDYLLPGQQTKVSWQGSERIIRNDSPYNRLYKRKRP